MTYENYYENPQVILEKVVLAKKIVVPNGYTPAPLKGKFFIDVLTPVIDMGKGKPREIVVPGAPLQAMVNSNFEGYKPTVRTHKIRNYIELDIPTYMQFEWCYHQKFITDIYGSITTHSVEHIHGSELHPHTEKVRVDFKGFKIPKGTTFLVAGINGSTKFEDLRIIGLWDM